MATETDDRGRLYLPSDVRERYGTRFHIIEYQDRIELVPVDEDPLKGLREAVGDAFEGKSIDELREAAIDEARTQAAEHVRRD